MSCRLIQLDLTPAQALRAWPADWPLAALWSGDPSSSRSRWTVLARPSRSITFARAPAAASASAVEVMRSVLPPPSPASMGPTSESPTTPGATAPPTHREAARAGDPDSPPFSSGWIGYLSYDLGRVLEPGAQIQHPRAQIRHPRAQIHQSPRQPAAPWPMAHWARADDTLIFDHARSLWWAHGDAALPATVRERARDLASSPGFTLSPLAPTTPRAAYLDAAHRVLEYIRAGDIYQANLAHRLEARFTGSSRSLFAEMTSRARPWYGAYLELHDERDRRASRALLSLSPELFFAYDAVTRAITTRPMKGTRRAGADPRELDLAPKDRAELNMIIDLLRNDLGRVGDFGSIRVERPREIEEHGQALLQATATITGRLRAGLSLEHLLAATFPGGSITGAPKIRAMQIIDELEAGPRGPYCGAVGFIADAGHAAFNIAIRSALISRTDQPPHPVPLEPASPEPSPRALDHFTDATLSYSVGAGIVADSSPKAEWEETLDKAAIWPMLQPTAGAP